ncbi:MAG: hypothetical protein P4K93_06090 [Terracidiphilus sp.]|nr:hypothetical protein [Terracidiphilus sp.]MDR3797701.1 hypothetical protein [Terracidiphilus sp.]
MRSFEPQQPESPDRAKTRSGFRALVRRRPCAATRPLPALLAASGFFAALFVSGLALAAQSPAPAAPAPAHPAVHPRKKPSAHKPAAQSAPAPASIAQSAPVPCPAAGSAPVPSPATPCIPNWPANKRPSEASVVWDSHGLFIQASNSSLDQILRDISLKTGAKVEGMGADERVFGTYGPGPVRDVLGELLEGSGYNILLVGDLGQGTPRRIVLSGRPTGAAQPSAPSTTEADDEQMTAPEAQPTGPQPQIPGSIPPPPVPARSPQVMMQQQQLMEQRREQQMQQMRQQQEEQQNNPENPQ